MIFCVCPSLGMRTDDPWHDALASGWGDDDARPAAPPRSDRVEKRGEPVDAHAAVYLTVQRSAAFQQVRRRHRRFVLPVSAAFLVWYLAYVVTATVAPGLMSRPVAGVLNVAMVAGLAQFASTFLLTWAYVRHARLRRDQLALELRWETQDMARLQAAAQIPAQTAGSAQAPAQSAPVRGGAARRADPRAVPRSDSRAARRTDSRANAPAPRTAWETMP